MSHGVSNEFVFWSIGIALALIPLVFWQMRRDRRREEREEVDSSWPESEK